MGQQAVRAPGRIHEHGLLCTLAASGCLESIARLIGERLWINLVTLGLTDVARRRQNHGHRLGRDQLRLVDRLGGLTLDQTGTTLIAVLFTVCHEFGTNQCLQARRVAENALQLVTLLRQRGLFAADLHLFQTSQVTQLGLENGFRLLVRQGKSSDQHLLRFVLRADDADYLIQIQIGDQQTVEDVQTRIDLTQSMLESPDDRAFAVDQPFRKQSFEPHHPRTTIQANHVHIDAIGALKVGGGEQMRHHLFNIDAIGPEF